MSVSASPSNALTVTGAARRARRGTFSPVAAVLALAAAGALAAACDPAGDSSDQDDGGAKVTLEGRAVDGPISRGRVYLDRSETHFRGNYDNAVRTGGDGAFSLETPVDGLDRIVLRVDDGRDRFHGLRVPATMSRHVTDTGAPAHITPVTSLLAYMSEDQRNDFLAKESAAADINLQMRHAAGNYLDFDDGDYTDAQRLHLIRIGYQAHKLVEVVAAELEERYPEIGGEDGLPSDGAAYVYPALAHRWVKTARFGDSSGGLEDDIEAVLEAAHEAAAAATGGEAPEEIDEDLVANLAALWDDLIGDADAGLFGAHLLDGDGAFETVDFGEAHVAARARAAEAATLVLRNDRTADNFVPGAANSIVDHLRGKGGEYDDADDGDFGPRLDVRGYALGRDGGPNNLLEHGDQASAADWDRGDPFDFSVEDFVAGNEDSEVVITEGDDGVITATVTHEGDEYVAAVEDLDGYTLEVDVEVGGHTVPGTLRKNQDGGYDFDFAGEVKELEAPE